MLKKLFGLGIMTILALFPAMPAFAEAQTEVLETNINGGVEITMVNEGTNLLKIMYAGNEVVGDENYAVESYRFYWDDGTTLVEGADGEEVFYRSHVQVEFYPEVELKAHDSKTISYEVYLKAQKEGLFDKVLQGSYDYSYCVNTVDYVADGSVFCTRGEWASGKSYFQAYNQDWRPLEPLPVTVVQEIVKEIEKIVQVEKVVEVEKEVEVVKEVEVPVETVVEKVVERVAEVEVAAGLTGETEYVVEAPTEGTMEMAWNETDYAKAPVEVAGNTAGDMTDDAESTEVEDIEYVAEGVDSGVTEVPELGELEQQSEDAGTLWARVLILIGISVAGVLIWWFLPGILRKKSKKV